MAKQKGLLSQATVNFIVIYVQSPYARKGEIAVIILSANRTLSAIFNKFAKQPHNGTIGFFVFTAFNMLTCKAQLDIVLQSLSKHS